MQSESNFNRKYLTHTYIEDWEIVFREFAVNKFHFKVLHHVYCNNFEVHIGKSLSKTNTLTTIEW